MISLLAFGREPAESLVVAAQNFGDFPNVSVTILVVGLIGLVLLMVVAGELGRRGQGEAHRPGPTDFLEIG